MYVRSQRARTECADSVVWLGILRTYIACFCWCSRLCFGKSASECLVYITSVCVCVCMYVKTMAILSMAPVI